MPKEGSPINRRSLVFPVKKEEEGAQGQLVISQRGKGAHGDKSHREKGAHNDKSHRGKGAHADKSQRGKKN